MLKGNTPILSKLAICFSILGLIFIVQITFMQDATRQILSISQHDWDLEANGSALITCDRSNEYFDICIMNSPTLLDHTSLTLFTLDSNTMSQHHIQEKIQPYPLKNDPKAISSIREFTLTSTPPKYSSQCGVTHSNLALVFSAGGYTGNFYHDFNEIFIPLYITINSLSPNKDVILVITDGAPWWFKKYTDLLHTFSPDHIIINTMNLTTIHCFPSAIIGLIKHGQMIIDSKLLPYPKTLFDFHAFLESTYIKKDTSSLYPKNMNKPILTLVSRKGSLSRALLNKKDVIKLAEDVGFNVHVLEASRDSSMVDAYRLIHSSHVILGVHGAGLTHLLFLRQGSMLVQIVPVGLIWASNTYYSKPTEILGLKYVEYKVKANESSLSWKYGVDSLVIKNPEAYSKGNWTKQLLYLKKQNVIIDLIRFRKCLTEVYKKVKIFMNTTTS